MSFLCTVFLRGFGIIKGLPSYYIGFRRPRQSATCTKYCRRICAEGRGGAPGRKSSCRRCPRRGGKGGGRLPPLPFRHPRGGLPFSSPAYPAFTFFSAPLSPHPPSPVGKGETKVIFMQGASPLASRGLNPRGAYSPCQSGAKRGACLFCRLPTLSLAYFPAPIPLPPFPPGRGRILLYFAGGSAPGTPALNRLRHLQSCQTGTRRKGKPAACCKSDRRAFLWAVPAAKERGDRGRGTSAFEMVLSPGAGRTGAAWGRHTPSPKIPPVPQMEILKKSYNV